MTMDEMLNRMSSVELIRRFALDSIRGKEAAQQERMAKAKRR